MKEPQSPLEGIRVIDLSRFISGPYCSSILGDMGAEIIEIERPTGSELREVGMFHNDVSLKWQVYHRNKKSLTLNLRSDDGKTILSELIASADVVLENFRPGTMEKIGFGYEDIKKIKPDAVLVSISGFGQSGPLASRPCFDAIAQGMSGLMSLNGEPDGDPMILGPGFFADLAAGTWAALGASLALFHRERTGVGQHVDASMLEAQLPFLMTLIPEFMASGVEPERMGNRDRDGVPANAFRTRDGMIYLDAGGEKLFRMMFEAMDLGWVVTDPRFSTYPERLKNRDVLEEIVSEWMCSKTTDEAMDLLGEVIPIGPVRTVPEVVNCPQVRERGYLVEVDDPTLEGVSLPGVPIKLSGSPGRIRTAAPTLGQHNEEILVGILGHSKERLNEWKEAGVI
jgi:crotonobetainyl-CoA:carnitine CoA-transferase CaiB-like acyl-CoA transferase